MRTVLGVATVIRRISPPPYPSTSSPLSAGEAISRFFSLTLRAETIPYDFSTAGRLSNGRPTCTTADLCQPWMAPDFVSPADFARAWTIEVRYGLREASETVPRPKALGTFSSRVPRLFISPGSAHRLRFRRPFFGSRWLKVDAATAHPPPRKTDPAKARTSGSTAGSQRSQPPEPR